MRPVPLALLTAAVVVVLSSCSDGDAPQPAGAAPPGAVRAQLGDVELVLEVADSAPERSTGLMGRSEVPPGTGMVFLFDEPSTSRFYMFDVPVPLVAVFVRDGVVVGVEQMPPCPETEPSACPTFGPDEPYDTVVETAPETLADVAVGDRLEPARPGA
jgi:uncharacterized membrane protein (UPF0127 family)